MFFFLLLFFCLVTCSPNFFPCLFSFPPFSPYAVGSHQDQSDKNQHPGSDKDARYQELWGRVTSWERRQNKRDKEERKGDRQTDRLIYWQKSSQGLHCVRGNIFNIKEAQCKDTRSIQGYRQYIRNTKLCWEIMWKMKCVWKSINRAYSYHQAGCGRRLLDWSCHSRPWCALEPALHTEWPCGGLWAQPGFCCSQCSGTDPRYVAPAKWKQC